MILLAVEIEYDRYRVLGNPSRTWLSSYNTNIHSHKPPRSRASIFFDSWNSLK